MRSIWVLAGVALWSSPVAAQTVNTVELPGSYAPGQALGFGPIGAPWVPVTANTPLPTAGKQEAYMLISANVPMPPAILYGGQYVVTQQCATYGSVAVRYRGPDGATMQALLTKTAADSQGGSLVLLGSYAVVDATVSGATDCNVQIARVP